MGKLCILLIITLCPAVLCSALKQVDGLDSEPTINSIFLNSLENKISALLSTVTNIDVNIKALQEKSLVWDLFRHHIESWNDQIKSLDHKIDLIKRSQDEAKVVETKLTSLEFTLNHILSKVVYLSDNGHSVDPSSVNDKHEEKFLEMHKILSNEKNAKREIVTRLSNILRHVLNVENESCRMRQNRNNHKASERIIGPVRNELSTDSHLRNIDAKLSNLTAAWSFKDMKQLSASSRKNTKSLEDILDLVRGLNEKITQIADNDARQSLGHSKYCQSISNEITTFTESSDLLLKRIEKLVRDVQTKVDKIPDSRRVGDKPQEAPILTTTIASERSSPESSGEVESSEKADVDFDQPNLSGCHELTTRVDGVYNFSTPDPNGSGRDYNRRYCAFPTDGVGYTVIQTRGPFEAQESFNRSWVEYRNGFGQLEKDFWFGNEFIYRLVSQDNYELRIEMDDFDGIQVWAEYSVFQIDSEKYNYNLMLGGYRGAVPDSMLYHHDQEFSTYDRRNDKSVDACCSCASGYGSGWWFDNCSEANLNGIYHDTPLGHNFVGIVWEKWHGDYSLKSTRMMIRPKTSSWTSGEQDEHIFLDP